MRKFLNNKVLVAAACGCLLFAATEATAQKRRPAARGKAAATKKPSAASNAAAVKAGADEISFQIKNLTKFIYLLGGSAQSLQTIETEAKQGRVSQTARQQSELGRKGLLSAITIQKNTMLDLEDRFRREPALKPYLLQLTGVGLSASEAEDSAARGDFQQAGNKLLEVLAQLTDTLRAMP